MLQVQHPRGPLPQFDSWPVACLYLNTVGIKTVDADGVLGPVLEATKTDPDEVWHSILTFLFWDQLRRIHDYTARLDDDPGHRFALISWRFLQATHRIDLASRGTKFGKKLFNDTFHDVREHYAAERDHPEHQAPEDEDDTCDYFDRQPGYDLTQARVEFQLDRERAIAGLRGLVRRGLINRPDYQILLGCHLYGRSIAEMAAHLGVPYEAAKKRRLRAVEKLQKTWPELSPDHADSPLYPIERCARKEEGRDE